MKYYTDITLLPSDDIGMHFLWSKVMMQMHLALVEIQDENGKVPIAVSFPNYRTKQEGKAAFVGNKLRVLAPSQEDLERLNLAKWFIRLEDYVHIKTIAPVPDNITEYESFNRRTKAGSPDKHIKRRMSRHNETSEQAAKFFLDYKMAEDDKALPFIKIRSLSSDNEIYLSIVRQPAEPHASQGAFSTYGLSANGVLPKF